MASDFSTAGQELFNVLKLIERGDEASEEKTESTLLPLLPIANKHGIVSPRKCWPGLKDRRLYQSGSVRLCEK